MIFCKPKKSTFHKIAVTNLTIMEKTTSIKMFNNPILELLSKSNPTLIICFHLCLASSILIIGISMDNFSYNSFEVFGYFTLGILSWSLTEYVIHRFIFHFENENKLVKAFHYAMHGHHHKNPSDKTHMFMPPTPAFVFVMLFLGLFYLLFGNYAFFFLPGFEIGYLIYSLVHFSVHGTKASKGPLKKLWLHHAKHHYQTPEKAFGVSSRMWDFIFKTMPEKELNSEKPTS